MPSGHDPGSATEVGELDGGDDSGADEVDAGVDVGGELGAEVRAEVLPVEGGTGGREDVCVVGAVGVVGAAGDDDACPVGPGAALGVQAASDAPAVIAHASNAALPPSWFLDPRVCTCLTLRTPGRAWVAGLLVRGAARRSCRADRYTR